MKDLTVFLMVFAILATSACAEEIDVEAEKAKIQSIFDQYVQAWKTQDMEMFAEIFAPDEDLVVVFTDEAEPFVGWESFKDAINKWFESLEAGSGDVSFRQQAIKVNASGTVAWVSCTEDASFIYQDQPFSVKGARVTWGLEKRNGKWVIVQAHFSLPSGERMEQ